MNKWDYLIVYLEKKKKLKVLPSSEEVTEVLEVEETVKEEPAATFK